MVKIYEIYEAANVAALPISPLEAAEAAGVVTVTYSDFSEIYCCETSELYRRSRFGFSFKKDGKYVIAINDRLCGRSRRRFTAAHELGHCLLGHFDGGKTITYAEERAADKFAAELLAPLCVLHFCKATSPSEISGMCGISNRAAEIRFGELKRKQAAGFDFLSGDGTRIVKQFSRYIEARAALLSRY